MKFITNFDKDKMYIYIELLQRLGFENFYIDNEAFFSIGEKKQYVASYSALYLKTEKYKPLYVFDIIRNIEKDYLLNNPCYKSEDYQYIKMSGIELKHIILKQLYFNTNYNSEQFESLFSNYYEIENDAIYEFYNDFCILKKDQEKIKFVDNSYNYFKIIQNNNLNIYEQLVKDFPKDFVIKEINYSKFKDIYHVLYSNFSNEISKDLVESYENNFLIKTKDLFYDDRYLHLLFNNNFNIVNISQIICNNDNYLKNKIVSGYIFHPDIDYSFKQKKIISDINKYIKLTNNIDIKNERLFELNQSFMEELYFTYKEKK